MTLPRTRKDSAHQPIPGDAPPPPALRTPLPCLSVVGNIKITEVNTLRLQSLQFENTARYGSLAKGKNETPDTRRREVESRPFTTIHFPGM